MAATPQQKYPESEFLKREKIRMVHKDSLDYRLRILIVTVSSSRSFETDVSGKNLEMEFKEKSHEVKRILCRDDETEILDSYLSYPNYDVYLFVGGTGPSRKDVTVQTLRKISPKEIAGFGELFRAESKDRFAYLSNATLFIRGKRQIYCIPGSPEATKVAFSIINSIMGHIFSELSKE